VPDFADVTKSWSQFKRTLRQAYYTPLTAKVGLNEFVVIEARRWSDEYDATKKFVPVTMTRLDRSIGYILQLIRDTGVTVVGKRGDHPVVILEAGEHWMKYSLAALGIDDGAVYDQAMQASALSLRLRRKERVLGLRLKQVRTEHQEEVANLEAKLQAAERANVMLNPARVQQELKEERRLREEAQDEARHLRFQLRSR
jgi:hypothetical protein